jgi:ABC-2 type transport system ATP-binding protein
VRDHIGYMGQKVSLYQGLSLRENVEFYAGLYGLAGADLEQRWGALRERFSLGESEREKVEDLPAGVRQRAGLAVAILHRPRVLFLDEPTAGVDIHTRGLFWDLIREEVDAGVTAFVTTHFLEEVEYCDRAAFIDAGRLIANARPEELRRRYADGYAIDIDLGGRIPAAALGLPAEAERRALPHPGGFHLTVPDVDADLFVALERLRSERGAEVRIHQPHMTEVFRRLVEAAGAPS